MRRACPLRRRRRRTLPLPLTLNLTLTLTRWAQYEPLLREALRRRPAECDVLVVSLGYDTLDGDPCAAEGHRLALQPADFGPMRRLLDEAGLPLLFLQEGGYHMEKIAAAAAAFWAG